MINDLSRPCTSTSGSSSAPENGPDHGVVKQKTCENTLSDGPAHFATTPPAAPMPAVTDADPDEPGRRGPLEWFRSARGPMRTVMRPAAIVAALAMIAGLWSLPEGIGFDATVTLAVFAIAVWLWSFTKIGDTYIALGAAVTLVLIGVIDADDAFEALGEDTTWLLIGAFVISGAVAASGLGVRAAVHLAAGCRPRAAWSTCSPWRWWPPRSPSRRPRAVPRWFCPCSSPWPRRWGRSAGGSSWCSASRCRR